MSHLRGLGRSLGMLSLVAVAFVSGCTTFPDTGPGREAVLEAAQSVLKERYPNATGFAGRYGQLYAVTPIGMEGAARSRKQISVAVRQNFTGAYEPMVSVVQYFDDSSGPLAGDPNSQSTVRNPLFRMPRWRPLSALPMEEVAVYEAIMTRVQPTGL